LIVSGIWKEWKPIDIPSRKDQQTATVRYVSEGSIESTRVRFIDTKFSDSDGRPVVVLLHGSPMASETFDAVLPYLESDFRLVVPDLPGFGRSDRDVSDYSIASHAESLASLLERLGVEESHLVGYSMGGGVALEFGNRYPDRVQSLTLVSSIGLQEYELLGDYTLNRALHAAQLFCLWAIDWLVPHFGWLDRALLNVQYARNFYDTDQRPLREALEGWSKPVLIVHGKADRLVPFEAAEAHRRLLPQAQVAFFESEGHLLIYDRPQECAQEISQFVSEVESGVAAERNDTREKLIPNKLKPKRNGWVMAALLAIATFASEDLACIGGGLLAAKGAVSLPLAILGCLVGIFVGDFAIYLMGRVVGKPALDFPVIRSVLKKDRVERCARWIDKKGITLVVSTRFVPGSRVPTYFAAGVLKANALRFALGLFVASAIWTPAIVGLAYFLGGQFTAFFEEKGGLALIGLLVSAILILLIARTCAALATWRGRRLLYSRIKRVTRWEYWPPWVFYPPVIAFLLWKMIRCRAMTILTAVNPCMPESGLVYESKAQILTHLEKHGSPVGRFCVISREQALETKIACLEDFKTTHGVDYPLVLKADVGQRGEGVSIVKSEKQAREILASQKQDLILQEFLSGREYGVFYYRYPKERSGQIFSVTDKLFVSVKGDGVSTLEKLILSDERAVGMARFYLESHRDQLDQIVPEDSEYPLTELGTHCRGALFLEGSQLITADLERAIDDISRGVEGFHFGRYDVRAPSESDLKKGKDIRIIELNGLTSESTNIYDPIHGLGFAYRTLFKQYEIAFEIARQSVELGNEPSSLSAVVKLLWRYATKKGPREKTDS